MVEKKQIVFDLMLKYTGPLSVEGFYEEVEKWMKERNLTKDLKRKSEEVTSKGKKIEWVIDAWREATHDYIQVVRLRALLNDVKEVNVKRKGKSIKINEADVLITIDGFQKSHLAYRWTQKPLYTFFRTLYDKYIWMIAEKHEGPVMEDCYDLHKRLKAFFELSKMKVA